MNPILAVIVVLAVIVIAVIAMYNTLIFRKNQVDNAQGAIDAYLKQRYNLIPNLVESVKAYAKHEKETLENIAKYRSLAMDAKDFDEKMGYENMLSSLLNRLMISVENYPELKANVNFLELQNSLNDIEGKISAARRAYNQAVTDYNNAIEMFPTNIVANFMGLKRKKVFEIPEDQKENVNVGDIFNK